MRRVGLCVGECCCWCAEAESALPVVFYTYPGHDSASYRLAMTVHLVHRATVPLNRPSVTVESGWHTMDRWTLGSVHNGAVMVILPASIVTGEDTRPCHGPPGSEKTSRQDTLPCARYAKRSPTPPGDAPGDAPCATALHPHPVRIDAAVIQYRARRARRKLSRPRFGAGSDETGWTYHMYCI